MVLGFMKPLVVSHTPPGAIADYAMVPLSVLMLIFSLKRPKKKIDNE
jgi:hypothetical protein